jgi:hypothetical protein
MRSQLTVSRRVFLAAGSRLIVCGVLASWNTSCRARETASLESTLRVLGVDLVGSDLGDNDGIVRETIARIVAEALADPAAAAHYTACATQLDVLSKQRGFEHYDAADPAQRASVLEAYRAQARTDRIERIGAVRARAAEYPIQDLLKRFYSSDAGWKLVSDSSREWSR